MPVIAGQIFWIFGLSGAGKSTMATALCAELRSRNLPVLALDGDRLRNGLSRDLGFSDDNRLENLRRAAEIARIGADSGLCVVASFITPLESHRRLVQEIIGANGLSLIFADSPLEVCRQRDVKGLYARAHAGQISHMTGVGSDFEKPGLVSLTLATSAISPEISAQALIDFAWTQLARSSQGATGRPSPI